MCSKIYFIDAKLKPKPMKFQENFKVRNNSPQLRELIGCE